MPVPPERNQSGKWLEKGTGVKGASLQGIHLRLPGYGKIGPTLEIYQYSEIIESNPSKPNKQGLGHLAFEVENVQTTLQSVIDHGGQALGEITEKEITGVGIIQFVYASDPDGNIIELQHWL